MRECVHLLVILFTGLVVQCSAMSISELEDFANFLKKTSQLDDSLKKGTDVNDFDEDEIASDHAWEESGKFEGDLILNERQRRMIVEDIAEGLSRNGLRDSTKKWPDNEVIYYIQKEHFSGDQIQAIQNGIDDLAQASCVKFRPYRKGDRDAVVIQGSRRGCFSQVGYQGGYQVLNLSGRHPVGRGCFRHGTVVHELLHSLGFYHMQSSPDRDDYVNIAWENILQPARHNFRKYNAFSVSDFGVGYDYDSVLHYSRGAFSSNGRDTIIPKQGGAQIGQRVGLSDKDAQKLNKMYCDADSNDNASDDVSIKSPTKKKNPKNKPFEGHGIGYHQGKTVVIKLIPSAETYHIANKPAYPMFHYFSKTPQVLSPKEIQGFGPGKRIAESYKPFTYTEGRSDGEHKEQNTDELKKLNTKNNGSVNKSVTENKEHETNVNNSAEKNSQSNKEKTTSEDENDDLSDAFKRLEKILKTHVYPTHFLNLKPYKVNTDYSEFADPKNIPKIVYDFVPIQVSKEEEDTRRSSESDYIGSLCKDGPKTLNREIQTYNPNKVEKIVYDPNSSKEIDIDEVKNRNQGNVKNQFRDSGDSLNPRLQQVALDKLKKPKEMYEIIEPLNVPKEAEAAYRTTYPFKVHQITSNGSIELKTPDYALYEHLKDKNDYSALYVPNTDENDESAKKQYTTFGEIVPIYDKWYHKDYLKRNPVDYGRPSFTFVSPDSKSDIREYDDSESSEHDPSYGSEYTGSFSPQTKQAYTLYGEPVPLTDNWYKINSQKLIEYPYSHYRTKENSESQEDKR